MASKVLTLKYRPQSFDELWVQDHVRDTLKRAIERNRLANAYLFCGPRGVGKTTTARILAKGLNCEKGPTTTPCNKCSFCTEITASRSMDVIEIDGASNRGIEQIRELRENIKYTPSSGRYKVYIIDEVHMLTEAAFNALLKTLEEPPAHAKFIFATTAAHDVPATIVSRCQRFDFRRATPAEIKDRLAWLAKQESIKASDAALMAIARRADGAIRDGEGILDQLASFRPDGIELKDVEELLGLVPSEVFFDYADMVLAGDGPGLMSFLARLLESGYDHIEFYSGMVQHFRNLLVLDVAGRESGLSLLPDEVERLTRQARSFGRGDLLRILSSITQYESQAGATQYPRVLLEVMSLELASGRSGPAPGRAGPHQRRVPTRPPLRTGR
jgi:DNA polymerase-3 subunit gamma/tau